MPNGKIHDHPISDILIHGLKPFPDDLVEMVKRPYAAQPTAIHEIDALAPFEWEQGRHLDEARETLSRLLAKYEVPNEGTA